MRARVEPGQPRAGAELHGARALAFMGCATGSDSSAREKFPDFEDANFEVASSPTARVSQGSGRTSTPRESRGEGDRERERERERGE
jgi:hypothetical protein